MTRTMITTWVHRPRGFCFIIWSPYSATLTVGINANWSPISNSLLKIQLPTHYYI